MEEILASIRRIIADDEAKPSPIEKDVAAVAPRPEAARPEPAKPDPIKPEPAKPDVAKPALAKPAPVKPEPAKAEPPKPAPPAAKAPVMTNIPPSAIAPKPVAKPAPAAAASNSQDDIDAMLAGLDADTTEAEVRPPLPDGDVFELTDAMAVAVEPPKPPFRTVELEDDLEFAETQVAARAPPREPVFEPPAPAPQPLEAGPPMLSRSTVNAVESAFNSLANTVLSNNARTLEDLVKEMLRPMLKSWLDDNLPGLVERIVKAEIERVSRGR
jgi:cell pole-organizing protein PopZ